MSIVSVNVDLDVNDVLGELDDEDLVEELQCRGYHCSKSLHDEEDLFTKQEINFLVASLDAREQPLHWELKRIRDKLIAMDYKK
jgi:hypothetical protein